MGADSTNKNSLKSVLILTINTIIINHKFPLKAKWKIIKEQENEISSWIDAVEQTHSLRLAQTSLIADSCQEEMAKIQHPPPGWSVEADEELARFMVQHGGHGIIATGVGNEFLKRVEASSGEVRYVKSYMSVSQ